MTVEEARQLRKEVQELRGEVQDLRGQLEGKSGKPASTEEQQQGELEAHLEAHLEALLDPSLEGTAVLAEQGQDGAMMAAGADLEESGLGPAFGGLYSKPFLRKVGSTYVGGYMDLEYRDVENEDRTFRFHRLIPFLYADVSENIKFATEIEIEDGEAVEIEFAFIDFEMFAELNVRAGVILAPLGKFNLVHDSPINDLTDRPLVNQYIIPTTLREPGAGFFGTFAADDEEQPMQLSYEAYVVSGFKGLMNDGTAAFNTNKGLKDGRVSKEVGSSGTFRDNNNSLAGVGRVAFSPVLGMELGASAHIGKYDEAGDHVLRILAADVTIDGKALGEVLGLPEAAKRVVAPFEVLAEGAHASLQTDAFARSNGIPEVLRGYYLQLNYHLFVDWLVEASHGWLDPDSHFTLVTRLDDVNLDRHAHKRWTFGVNFRPNQYETVIKFDYQINIESGLAQEEPNDAFLMSIATYF
jgi:hypothetical protein